MEICITILARQTTYRTVALTVISILESDLHPRLIEPNRFRFPIVGRADTRVHSGLLPHFSGPL